MIVGLVIGALAGAIVGSLVEFFFFRRQLFPATAFAPCMRAAASPS